MCPARFVILSQPRTGSTLLCSLLNSSPGVRSIIEPINMRTHSHHMKPHSGVNRLVPYDIVQNDLKLVMDTLLSPEILPIDWDLSNKRGDLAVGFKIMAHQIQSLKHEHLFWNYLSDNNIKIIVCFRNNILMQYISDLITIETKQSACWNGIVKTAKVNVDVSKLGFEFDRILQQKKYILDNVDKFKLCKRKVKYEDFKNDYTQIENIYTWLTGQKMSLTTKLSKQNSDNLCDRVINYQELVCAIKNLGYGHLLEGV